MNRADFVASFNEIPDEGRPVSSHSGNSQTVFEDHSKENANLAARNEKFQHLPEQQTESVKHKSRAGFFSRLRRKLGLRSEELTETRSSSSVRATHIGDLEVTKKIRAPHYQCVPNPPGCIPTEVMIKVESEYEAFYFASLNRSGLEEKQTDDGANHIKEAIQHGRRNEYKNMQENAIPPSKVQICKDSKPTKVLYNNWVGPELEEFNIKC